MKGKKVLRDKQNRKNVFVNEDLTRKRYGWMMKARWLRKQGKIRSCWSTDGVLFVKFTDSKDEKPERIDSDTEMADFLSSRSLAQSVAGINEVHTRSDSVFSASTDVDEF
ncbi:hypothetical protein FSP39_024414 [Pinctada imbricata]|uniref:Uncharacterized protein n=1 Tax=Pinctada imbricata TaxID=66713 RepID=A0AA89BTL1_PINIB|nr:hypothetical protein FSP39_024414 [Pinctada imbricata]